MWEWILKKRNDSVRYENLKFHLTRERKLFNKNFNFYKENPEYFTVDISYWVRTVLQISIIIVSFSEHFALIGFISAKPQF